MAGKYWPQSLPSQTYLTFPGFLQVHKYVPSTFVINLDVHSHSHVSQKIFSTHSSLDKTRPLNKMADARLYCIPAARSPVGRSWDKSRFRSVNFKLCLLHQFLFTPDRMRKRRRGGNIVTRPHGCQPFGTAKANDLP